MILMLFINDTNYNKKAYFLSLCYIEYIMDLEQLQLESDKDLKINDTELDLESLKTLNYTTNI